MTAPRLSGAEIVARIYSAHGRQPADDIAAKLAALVDAVAVLCDDDDVSEVEAEAAVYDAYRALIEEAKR